MSSDKQKPTGEELEAIREQAAQLFMRHFPLIRHIAMVSAPRAHLRDDIVNDAFVTFVNDSWKWDLGQPVKPLLRKLTIRSASVYWRSHLEKIPDPLADISEAVRSELFRIDQKIGEEDMDRELETLCKCLKTLTPRCQELLEEHYYHKVPIVQLAQKTGQSLAALYKLFIRVRIQLKTCIENTLKASGL